MGEVSSNTGELCQDCGWGRLVLERVVLIPSSVMVTAHCHRHNPSLPLAYLSQKLLKDELF